MEMNLTLISPEFFELEDDAIADCANNLADAFARSEADGGEPLRNLIPLLTHQDERFVALGVWVASEVADGERGREFFEEVVALLSHENASIRFEALACASLLVKPNESHVMSRLVELLIDPNKAVRSRMLRYACLIPDAVIESLYKTEHASRARTLLEGVEQAALLDLAASDEWLDQRIAVAGAMRNFGENAEFLEKISRHFDKEVSEFYTTLPCRKKV